MTKEELVAKMAEKAMLPKTTVNAALNAFCAVIAESLAKGERVTIPGFGSFDVTYRDARKGRNPKTGEAIDVPAKITPKFSAGSHLKQTLN